MSDNGYTRPELVCPAGTPAALKTAVDAGADAVYCGLQNATNARNFPGLNFTPAELEQSLAYAHSRQAKLLLAVNTFPPAGQFDLWRDAVDLAAKLNVDAVIVGDIGVADYAAQTYPNLRLHLSVQAGASSPEAIRFYCQAFAVKRVVLPNSDCRRDRRAPPGSSLRNRSIYFWQYRYDGGRPLQPYQLHYRRLDEYGWSLLARRRCALRGG